MQIDVRNLPRKSSELMDIVKQLVSLHNKESEENETLQRVLKQQQKEIDKQREEIDKQHKQIEYLALVNRHQEEIIAARNRRLFGRKSEKMSYEDTPYWLFNEAEAVIREKLNLPEKKVAVTAHVMVKRGRKPITDKLPRVEIVHDISDDEKKCAHCPKIRPRIGEDVSEELSIIPMRVFVKHHVYPKYGPCYCKKGKNDKELKRIIRAPREKRIIPGSMADASLLAYLAVSKFCDSLN